MPDAGTDHIPEVSNEAVLGARITCLAQTHQLGQQVAGNSTCCGCIVTHQHHSVHSRVVQELGVARTNDYRWWPGLSSQPRAAKHLRAHQLLCLTHSMFLLLLQNYTDGLFNATAIQTRDPAAAEVFSNRATRNAFFWVSHTFQHQSLGNASFNDCYKQW